jgi:hypothetical protein
MFMSELLETLREVIEFATQLSSDNMCTWIVDDSKPDTRDPSLQVDCRGHFYFKKEDEQSTFKKSIGALMSGNTLIESLETTEDATPENILVVSFYLVTREAGEFFKSLASLIQAHDRTVLNVNPIVEPVPLRAIVYQFFHALLNIKHLGSIDRIA